jgi:hypothetical protein
MRMSDALPVDPGALREEVKTKYRAVAVDPHGGYHFHTGRPLAKRLGYDEAVVGALPDSAVEAFAGVGNPFSLGAFKPGSGWSISAPAAVSTVLSRLARSDRKAGSWAST